MLDEYPIFIITFQSDEIHCFVDKKGEVILGGRGNLRNSRYAIAFTKKQLVDAEAVVEEGTHGWVVMQFAHLTL